MNKEQDQELDDLFKKGLGDPVDQAGYQEEDWGSLEQMLNKNKRRRIVIYRLPILGVAAAILLLFLAWWFFKPQATPEYPKNRVQAVVHHEQKNTGKSDGPKQQPIDHKQSPPLSPNYAENSDNSRAGGKSKSFFSRYADRASHDTTGHNKINTFNRPDAETLAAISVVPNTEQGLVIAQPINSTEIPGKVVRPTTQLRDKFKGIKQSGFRPRFALTVLAASDLNGVGSFQQSQVGSNAGLLFSVNFSKKFTITTGAVYSVKPYNTGFGNYHTPYTFPVTPTKVSADCRMFDIPIDIGYQVYNKHLNKISIGTGLSSYIMVHESYKFSYSSQTNNLYANHYETGPTNYTVPNNGGYYLGVLNLNATYERQLNTKVGITLEPYLKLPLTNIGYSQARLQTTGIAVGLNWHLN